MYILRRITPLTVAMLAVLLALAFGALAMFGGNRADAASVTPEVMPGNQNCAQLIPGSLEIRIEPVADGTYPLGAGPNDPQVTIDVRNTNLGQVFDFTAKNATILGVAVKGGPNTNFYDYRPGG